MFPFILPHFLYKHMTYNDQVLLLALSLEAEDISLRLINGVGSDLTRVVDAKHGCHFTLISCIKRGQELRCTSKLL